jgi:methionyl aminopeptidase
MRVILLGPPGVGKGTQGAARGGARLAADLDGELLRDAVAQRTPLGDQARRLMDAGQLVPDGVMIGLVQDRLSQPDAVSGFVLDGFPRTGPSGRGARRVAEGERSRHRFGAAAVGARGRARSAAEEAVGSVRSASGPTTWPARRRGHRASATTIPDIELVHRADDDEVTVRSRLSVYDGQTRPLIGYYKSRNRLAEVGRASALRKTCSRGCGRRSRCSWEVNDGVRAGYGRDRCDSAPPRRSSGARCAMLAGEVRPGVSTRELDRLAETFIRDHGAEPAFKGYRGFPATICPSVNDRSCTRSRATTGCRKATSSASTSVSGEDGYYGDAARTFPVGDISDEARQLLEVTEAALLAGIAQAARATGSARSAGRAVTREEHGFSVVRSLVGHGIGARCTRSRRCRTTVRDAGTAAAAGQVLAIEPMVNVGGPDVITKPMAGRW